MSWHWFWWRLKGLVYRFTDQRGNYFLIYCGRCGEPWNPEMIGSPMIKEDCGRCPR